MTRLCVPALQDWFNDNRPADELLWKNGLAEQVIFVRDVIHPLFVPRYEDREEHPVHVISTHRSKSVVLPVFELCTLDWINETTRYGNRLRLVLRDNFYNWTVSVQATYVNDRFRDLFDREVRVNHVYAEGFVEADVFPPYAEDRSNFTLQLHSKYELYTFCWLLTHGGAT
jgi:hypothetical protein